MMDELSKIKLKLGEYDGLGINLSTSSKEQLPKDFLILSQEIKGLIRNTDRSPSELIRNHPLYQEVKEESETLKGHEKLKFLAAY